MIKGKDTVTKIRLRTYQVRMVGLVTAGVMPVCPPLLAGDTLASHIRGGGR